MIEAASATPAPYERGEKTRAEMARELGISVRHLRRLLAKERAEAEWSGPEPETLDRFDYPYMELTNTPLTTNGDWYGLESCAVSRESGKVHIGGKVRSLRGGTVTTEDSSRTDGKPQPTAYTPDPRLKGGVG